MHDVKKLNETINKLGGRKSVMTRLGVSAAVMSFWCTGKSKLPVERAIQLSQMSNGEVSFYDLIPELKNIGK